MSDRTGPNPPDESRPAPIEPYYADFPEQDLPPEPAEELALRPRPERIKRAALVGVRVVTGTVGVLVAAAAVAAAALVPLPSYTAAAPSVVVTPVATTQQLVCPGSLLTQSSDGGATDATATTATGVAGVTSASSEGAVLSSAFTASDAGTGGTDSAPRLLSTDSASSTSDPVLISGAQDQSEKTDDLFGLAAASCAVASGDSWLVGGATTTGRTTLITLSNPSDVAATVDLSIFGEQGAVSSPGLTGISVEPDAQRVLSLAGFAPQLASPVVHVQSRGGLVVANLQQTTVRGIEPGGADTIGVGSAPSTSSTIPGVVVSGSADVAGRVGEEGYDDLTPILRILVPGTATASARVDVKPEDGSTTGTSFEIDVPGGVVTDLPISDLADGDYTVTVATDVASVAAVRTAVVGTGANDGLTDFGWFSAAQELDSDSLVSVAAGVDSGLHLANPTAADVTVTVTPFAPGAADGTPGTPSEVVVAAGSSASMPVGSGASYRISGFDSLYASVSATMDGGLAGYTVVPRAPSSSPIRVYP